MIRRVTLFVVAACLAAPVHAPLAAQAQQGQAGQTGSQSHTILIRHGRVLDGTGNPWIYADVLIRGDRIAAVGDLADTTADEVIDATGLYVAPGFIDTHSHAAPGLATPGLSPAHPLLAQGITTIFANPDGGGPVDLAAQRRALEKDGLGVNVAQLVSQGSVRKAVMGDEDRDPTPAEMERMKELVRRGMAGGAWGMSSGTFYVPGFYSKPAEIEELAKLLTPYGAPYQSHIRDESDYTVGLMAAVDEVIHLGRVDHIPVILTHVKALGPDVWGFGQAIVERVERARAEGIQVFADQYPYTASSTSLSAALLPRWAQADGRDSLKARMARPADRTRIRAAVVKNLARRGGAARIQFASYHADPSVEGKLLSDVAADRGKDPVDEALDLIGAGRAGIVSYNMNEGDVETLMAQPWTMTASDGGLVPMGQGVPHPRFYGTFPRKIRLYAMEKHVITLEHAIRSMTSLPAWVWKLPDRGVLRAGAAADVVIFDLAKLKDTATYTKPHQLAQGMVWVFVNGQAAIARGSFTGTLAGKVLLKVR